MGLCLKEQIYQMSGLASKVLCGYGFPVALWTCKAKSPITSKTPPWWVGLWSLAKQPHQWASPEHCQYAFWTAFQGNLWCSERSPETQVPCPPLRELWDPENAWKSPWEQADGQGLAFAGSCFALVEKAESSRFWKPLTLYLFFCRNAVL